jgi:surfactin synthase thioesterase subunit
MKQALHFTHANGIPSATYQKFLDCFQQDYEVKAIPFIGMNPQYPITRDWRYLVDEVIADIEQQFPQQQVIGLGHSFGGLGDPDGGVSTSRTVFQADHYGSTICDWKKQRHV